MMWNVKWDILLSTICIACLVKRTRNFLQVFTVMNCFCSRRPDLLARYDMDNHRYINNSLVIPPCTIRCDRWLTTRLTACIGLYSYWKKHFTRHSHFYECRWKLLNCIIFSIKLFDATTFYLRRTHSRLNYNHWSNLKTGMS